MLAPSGLRMLAALLAVVSAALHLALYLWDLIPGQPTAGGLPFLVMTVLYLGVAAVVGAGSRRWYAWSAGYTAVTIVGYFVTRVALGFPIEVWGLADKAVEVALLLCLVALIRTRDRVPLAR